MKEGISLMIPLTWKGNITNKFLQKFDNLGEMGQFLERYKLPESIQKEKDKMNSPIFTKDNKYVVKKLYKTNNKKKLGLDNFITNI